MPAINVTRQVKVDGKWLRLPVSKVNGKLDWTHVLHGGVPLVSTEGTFYLEWREGGRKIRRAVGNHPRDAKAALSAQVKVVDLRGAGMQVEDAPQIAERRRQHLTGKSIAEAIEEFQRNAGMKYRPKSVAKYQNALDSFERWAKEGGKTHLCQLTRDDLVDYMGYLVTVERLDHSTAVDKGHVVHGVFNDRGAAIVMKRGDWPKVVEQEREPYEDDVLDRLFSACTQDEFELFQTFLLTGFRDQEVGYLSWEDFNARRGTLSATAKLGMGFKPKSFEERTVPIPASLTTLLVERRKRHKDDYLIFPTSSFLAHQGRPGGQRDRHMLDRLKKIAYRAKLNCGRCESTWHGKPTTCAKAPICSKFGLHRFRHTYATAMLRGHVDLISVQKLLGHSDLESTRKYLKALEPEDLHAKIAQTPLANRVFQRAS